MLIESFLSEQRVALTEGDAARALELLNELEKQIDRGKAWSWLRQNEPETYDQLVDKLEDARQGLAASGRTQLGQMIRVFTWCRDHDITLEALGVPGHLHKYREASAKLSSILTSSDEEWEIKQELLSAIGILKSHPNRAATRAWARTSRERGSRQEGS